MDYIINYTSSVYGISITVIFIMSLISKGFKIPNYSLSLSIFIMLFITILFGLRTVDTGTDTLTYLNWYESLGLPNPTRYFEPLFTIIGRCIYFFTPSGSWFFSIISFLTLFFLALSYNRSSSIYAVPLGLVISVAFVSGTDLMANGIRNGLALSIATYGAIKFIRDEKVFSYLFIVFMSTMIHASCFIFLALVAVKHIKTERCVKICFYSYLIIFTLEAFKVFDFVFMTISDLGIGSHIISRLLAFKYQESDMFAGAIKYYFFVITLIPYMLYYFKYNINTKMLTMHYMLLIPFAMIFSSPSSYRFSYLSFYIMIGIICQASLDKSPIKRVMLYTSIFAMIVITYGSRTSLSYGNILFS